MGIGFDERETLATKRQTRGAVFGLRRMADGKLFELPGKKWTLGSSKHSDIVLDDQCVSKRHCMIERDDSEALIVRDMTSRNGTFVDGNLVLHAELRVGSSLVLGHTTLLAVGSPQTSKKLAIEKIIGRDPSLLTTIMQAQRCATQNINVLILGETGTGKDLLAQLIHETSQREGAFVAVNCGALPAELVGAQLFGHDRGAYTGAEFSRDGYFLEADRGTLFLDEIGELPLEMQPHLLRVLETKKVRPVGGERERSFDTRIVAATNRIAGLGTEQSRMRSDLYHRLATVILTLPPLRERMADLDILVPAFLDEYSYIQGECEITDNAWQAMLDYDWPGNVRELRATLNRAMVCGNRVIDVADLFGPHQQLAISKVQQAIPHTDEPTTFNSVLRASMASALDKHKSIRAAAASIGMPKSTFADKARMWDLNISRRRLSVRNPTRK